MADLPAKVLQGQPLPAGAAGTGPAGSGAAAPGLDMSFLLGFGNLPVVRQIGLMVGLAASVALGFGVVLWSKDVEYRPLTGVVSARQTNDVAEVLGSSGIPYRIDSNSGLLLVPSDRIHEARMKMAGASIVDGSQMGFELLDGEQGFGVSQFMEVARYRRSLEGELSRSIASLNLVQNARVHLAIPKSSAFLRDQRRTTASVTLGLMPGARLNGDQVQAVMNLVAGAVPELSADDVAVVDQTGKLLSRENGGDPALERTERQLSYVNRLESQLQEKVANILTTVAGTNRFRAEVNADVDFTAIEQTAEAYDPDTRVVRSEQSMEESRGAGELALGVPGALSNRPPGAATAPETAEGAAAEAEGAGRPGQVRVQSTRNFEVDRTISHTRRPVGQISRLTVSVVVDGGQPEAVDGEVVEPSWTEAELEGLRALVRTAVGFDEARGDIVTVVSSPFADNAVELLEAPPFWMESWFLELSKQALGAVIVLLIVLVLLRPLFRNLSKAGDTVRTQRMLMSQADQPMGTGAAGAALPSPFSDNRNLESVRSMVSESPETVARVVKQWTSANE